MCNAVVMKKYSHFRDNFISERKRNNLCYGLMHEGTDRMIQSQLILSILQGQSSQQSTCIAYNM